MTGRPIAPFRSTGRGARVRCFAKYAGQFADGFICTSGKAPELYRDALLAQCGGGKFRGRPAAGRRNVRHDDSR